MIHKWTNKRINEWKMREKERVKGWMYQWMDKKEWKDELSNNG